MSSSLLSPLIQYVNYIVASQDWDTPFIDGLAHAHTELTKKSLPENCINEVFGFFIESTNQKAVLRRSIKIQNGN